MTHLLLAIAYLTSGTVLLLALAAHNSLTPGGSRQGSTPGRGGREGGRKEGRQGEE